MSRIESSLSSSFASQLGATVLRVALGAVFLAHAGAKAFIFTFAGTAQYFEAHGFPGWTAWPVFLAELLGGLALVVGFRVRWVALGLMPVMLGALKPHLGNGWMFTSSGGGWEYVAFLLLALGAQALMGSGAFSIDGVKSRHTAAPGRAVGATA